MSKRILVTGGAGFIGSHFLNHLQSELGNEDKLTIIDDLRKGSYENIPMKLRFNFIEMDVASLSTEMPNVAFDEIYHFAAETNARSDSEDDYRENLLTSISLMSFLKKGGRYYFISSASVYGDQEDNDKPPKEEDEISEDVEKNLGYYPASKLHAEKHISEHLDEDQFITFRLTNVFGPGQEAGESGIVAHIENALKTNEPLALNNNGEIVRDFVHVDDVCEAIIQARRKYASGVYNVGHNLFRIKDIIDIFSVPHYNNGKVKEASKYLADHTKAVTYLDWYPKKPLVDYLLNLVKE